MRGPTPSLRPQDRDVCDPHGLEAVLGREIKSARGKLKAGRSADGRIATT